MARWYVVTKDGTDFSANYPISIIHNNLGSTNIPYARVSKIDFSNANVILHCVWKKNQYDEWKGIFPHLVKAKNFWLEFDADNHLDKLHGLDEPKNISRFFYKIFEPCNKFIWEQPLFYNPFIRKVERIPLRFYTPVFERGINENKDIDFFTCIDTNKNILETLELFTRLRADGFKLCLMFLNKNLYNFYKDKLDFPVIVNKPKFHKESVRRFEELMSRSKVYVDLSYRLTTGRVVYDALYRGTYFVGTNTYGASEFLFPEYVSSTYPVNLTRVYSNCKVALDNWSIKRVEDKRKFIREYAGIEGFIKDLRERSE